MNVDVTPCYLRDETGALIPAELYHAILPRHIDQHEQHWKPLLIARGEEHSHWDWREKIASFASQLRYQTYALECQSMVQGLMIVNTIKYCRLPPHKNKHLVYVEYLEAAPWNRSTPLMATTYKGVGTVLIAAAIQLSIDEGNGGRIGLHSLPQADAFYRDRCQMSDLGPDHSYPHYPLRYFEMTETQAANFMKAS